MNSISLEMADDLNFLKMEDNLYFQTREDNLNVLAYEEKNILIFFRQSWPSLPQLELRLDLACSLDLTYWMFV
jgi:hypothetical protein